MNLSTRLLLTSTAALLAALCSACSGAVPPAAEEAAAQSGRRFLNTGAPPNGFTHTVTTPPGTMVFVSGAAGRGADGEMPEDFRAQAENTFKNLAERLALAGADFDDVVKVTYFISPEADMSILREVRSNYLNMEQPPAASAIPAPFAGAMKLEVEAIAVLDD